VRLGGVDQRGGERVDRARRVPGRVAREERDVRRDLVVARARGVQLAADRTRDLRHAALDRHVDVLVAVLEREDAGDELLLDGGERREQLVTVAVTDDLAGGEHAGVRARLCDIVVPQAPVERQRRVEACEDGVLRLGEARHRVGECR
jgi:hypothetical protein